MLLACLPPLEVPVGSFSAAGETASVDTAAATLTDDTGAGGPSDTSASGDTAVTGPIDTDTGDRVDTGGIRWDGTYQGAITAQATRTSADTGRPSESIACQGELILVVAADSAAPIQGGGRCEWTGDAAGEEPLQFVFEGELRAGDTAGGDNQVYWTPRVQFSVTWEGAFTQPGALAGTTAGGDSASDGLFFEAAFELERL